MSDDINQHALKQLSVGLGLLGLCCGFLAAYGVLSGDSEGRVNLLFLLLLFAFLPVVGLLLSLFLLLKGGGKGLAGWILDIPLWPRHLTLSLTRFGPAGDRQLWFFYQTQILAVSFSVGCLLLYLLLLLGSDITFVWRSTLLEAENLLPALQLIGLPWAFWPEAQASLALIERTQDFRLDAQALSTPVVGLWWKYILAAQLTYNLIPRSLMLLLIRRKYQAGLKSAQGQTLRADTDKPRETVNHDVALAKVTEAVDLPYILLNWGDVSPDRRQQIQQQLGEAASVVDLSPLAQVDPAQNFNNHSLVVLVKSWEPPLAELADCLRDLTGVNQKADKLILPLDWNESGLKKPSAAHLDEWRRFTATLPGWQVLQLETGP